MDRLLIIAAAASVGIAFFYWFTRAVRKQAMQDFIHAHLWLMHPNAICYWRAAMAIVAYVLYFVFPLQSLAILIFTFAAILDGVDGVVARSCNLGSKLGEWLDPLCDKLTYLPPLVGFAYAGILSVKMVWILVVIEFAGQFFARKILSMLKISGAANNFGKIKAIICFVLVIFCALIDKHPDLITNIGREVLAACIILSAASVVFKFIPNRLYADLLSTLNFFCGVTALYLAGNMRFAGAICVIIVGQLFDLFDGRMAEKHGGTPYGPYLDDIADFVSFGLAPAYVIYKAGATVSLVVGALFIAAVGYRLYRFIAVDQKRSDLPEGIFNGLPSPAGALIVLGASLVLPPVLLSIVSVCSAALMVSRIRFAHFGRIVLKQIPKPLFFSMSAAMVVTIAYLLKTKSVQMFGYMILCSVILYMITGRRLSGDTGVAGG